MIKPLHDLVLLEKLATEETTISGLVIPESAGGKVPKARVIAVGPGKQLDNGDYGPMLLHEGDVVYYQPNGQGLDIVVDGKKLYLTSYLYIACVE